MNKRKREYHHKSIKLIVRWLQSHLGVSAGASQSDFSCICIWQIRALVRNVWKAACRLPLLLGSWRLALWLAIWKKPNRAVNVIPNQLSSCGYNNRVVGDYINKTTRTTLFWAKPMARAKHPMAKQLKADTARANVSLVCKLRDLKAICCFPPRNCITPPSFVTCNWPEAALVDRPKIIRGMIIVNIWLLISWDQEWMMKHCQEIFKEN